MTPEIITTVVAVFGSSATVLGGVLAMLAYFQRRIDTRFDRMDARFDRLEGDVGELRRETAANTIAIARLEGPVPRFVTGARR